MSTRTKLARKCLAATRSRLSPHAPPGAIAPPPTMLPPGALIDNVSQTTAPIQAKLTVGAVGDRYEQEADRVAAEVVHRINAPTTQSQTLAASPDHELTAPNLAPTVQRQPLAPTIQRDGGLLGMLGGASASSAAAPAFVVSNPGLSAQAVKDDVIAKTQSQYASYDALASITWPDVGFALEKESMANEWHFINAVGQYQKSPTKSLFLGIMRDHIDSSGIYAVNLTSRTLRNYKTKAEEMQTTGEIDSPAANHFNDGLLEAGKFIINRTMPSYKQVLDTSASASAMSAG